MIHSYIALLLYISGNNNFSSLCGEISQDSLVSFKSTVLISCCLHVSNFNQFSKCLYTWSEAVVYLPTLFGKIKLKQQNFFLFCLSS